MKKGLFILTVLMLSGNSDKLKAQNLKSSIGELDTICANFLYEYDSKIVMSSDVIHRPAGFVCKPRKDNLNQTYRNGIFLFDFALGLGPFRFPIQKAGLKIMSYDYYKHLSSSIFSQDEDETLVRGYTFIEKKLTVVYGMVGKLKVRIPSNSTEIVERKFRSTTLLI